MVSDTPDKPRAARGAVLSRLAVPDYVRIGSWLLKDAFGSSPIGIAFLVGLGFIGTALQASVLVTLYGAINLLATPGDVTIPQLDLIIKEKTAFQAVAVMIVVQATLSSIFTYAFGVRVLDYRRRYHLYISERLLGEITRAVREERIDGADLHKERLLLRILSTSTQKVSNLFRRMMFTVSGVIRLALLLALSLYVHAGVTLMLIIGGSVVGLISVLKFARNSSQKARTIGDDMRAAKRQWRGLIETAARGETIPLDDNGLRDQPIGVFHRAFQARFIDLERSGLSAKICIIVLIATTLAIFGGPVLEGEAAWQDLATALAAIFITMQPLAEVAGFATVFGRFYPDIQAYRGALDAFGEAQNDKQLADRLAAIAGGFSTADDDENN